MRLVIIESPYAGDIEANVEYARAAVRDSLKRGEAPIASHLLYTQPGILRDEVPDERQWGIDAGLAWRSVAQATVVYEDHGISSGMRYGIEAAERDGIPVEYRQVKTSDGPHSSHKTRFSDASSFDEICTQCGATDRLGTWGKLAEPCPKAKPSPSASDGEGKDRCALR